MPVPQVSSVLMVLISLQDGPGFFLCDGPRERRETIIRVPKGHPALCGLVNRDLLADDDVGFKSSHFLVSRLLESTC